MSICVRQSDFFSVHSIKRYWKDMENGRKWSWKVMEKSHEKVWRSCGKLLSLICTHPTT